MDKAASGWECVLLGNCNYVPVTGAIKYLYRAMFSLTGPGHVTWDVAEPMPMDAINSTIQGTQSL
jgi:hypothetical protein